MKLKYIPFLLIYGVLISQVNPPFIGDRFRSFRYLSTVGLIEDDLDLLLDPGRYFEVEKNILFSGLSNIATNNDMPFSGIDGAYFMFGFKNTFKPLGNLVPLSLLYSHQTLKTPQPNFLGGKGETENFISERYDTDGNGSLDSLHTEKIISSSFRETKENPFFLGAAREMGNMIGGLFFFHSKFGEFFEPAGHPIFNPFGNLYYLREERDNVNGTLLEREEWTGLGKRDSTFQNNMFGAGLYIKELILNSDLGLQIGYGINSIKIMEDIYTRAYTDFNPGGSLSREDRIYQTFFNLNPSGSSYFIRFFTRRIVNQNYESEDNLYFTFLSSGISKGNTPFKRLEDIYLREDIGTGTLRENRITNETNGSIEYEDKGNQILLGYRFKGFIDTEKRVFFAFGFFFTNYIFNSTLRTDSNFQNVNTFNDGDNELSDPDDYITTIAFSRSDEVESSLSRRRVELPVACEMKLSKNILFRLGANPYFVFTEDERTFTPLYSSTRVTRTVRGDGTETIAVDPQQISTGRRNLQKGKTSGVNFAYGLSYKIGENFSMDLMGFSNLTNLASWKVSVIFKF